MNLILKVSGLFEDLQVNILLTTIFLDFLFQKALLIIYKRLGIKELSSIITIKVL